MSRYVNIATVAPNLPQLPYTADIDDLVKQMEDFWQGALEEVLPSQPDLILLPEACDRYDNFNTEQKIAYVDARGDRMLDFFSKKAKKHNTYIVYSAARRVEDGTYRNSSQLIDRMGKVVGIYNKNYLVETEVTEYGMLCGAEAPVFETDFGRVAMAICFDLNFEGVLNQYKQSRPEMILFSSRYHGGFNQQLWAYECRSYFIGACHLLPSEIVNPVGHVMASSTSYYPYTTAKINLDYAVVHLDFHWDKLLALRTKYREQVQIFDPGFVGVVLAESHHPTLSIHDILAEFEIVTWDEYFEHNHAIRENNMEFL